MPKPARVRLRIIVAAILLLGALFIGRLYDHQVVRSGEFLKEAKKQYIATIPNIYDRGSIYFKDKNGKAVTAATIIEGYVITINPEVLADNEAAYKAMNTIVPLEYDGFM
ncbi:MAG: hypothetical protein AAB869_02520, partial [Patescibacteria group bacterium]